MFLEKDAIKKRNMLDYLEEMFVELRKRKISTEKEGRKKLTIVN